jgi:hypothetical protein
LRHFSFSTASGILKSFSLDNISSLIATFSLLYLRRATIVKILSGLLSCRRIVSHIILSIYTKTFLPWLTDRQLTQWSLISVGATRKLPAVVGQEFLWSLKRVGGEMASRLDIYAMGRGAMRERFEGGLWGNTFCMDCEDSNSRGTGGEQPQYFLSAMDALKTVINVLKTAFITVLSNQILHQICSSGRFIFP